MNWMRERDALIAQTLEFVQSVTGKNDDLGKADRPSATPPSNPESATLAAVEYALGALPPTPRAPQSALPKDIRMSSSRVSGEVAAEVRDRIEGFRKHQERFRREREEYFTTTLAKVRDAIHAIPPPRREK